MFEELDKQEQLILDEFENSKSNFVSEPDAELQEKLNLIDTQRMQIVNDYGIIIPQLSSEQEEQLMNAIELLETKYRIEIFG